MLLDTNAISAWSKNDHGLWKALRPDRTWYLPSIALGEYRYGLLKSLHRVEMEGWLDAIEKSCIVLSADAVTAHHYAELRLAVGVANAEVLIKICGSARSACSTG